MDMLKVTIDVHGSPSKNVHTWAELVLKILKVRHEEGLGVRADLGHDAVVLTENESKFVVVHLELFFLEQDDLGTLRDLNTNTAKALSLTDQCHNLRVEVDVELVIVRVTDDESGKETSLGLLDFNNPPLPPFVLEVEEVVSDVVVGLNLSDSPLGLV